MASSDFALTVIFRGREPAEGRDREAASPRSVRGSVGETDIEVECIERNIPEVPNTSWLVPSQRFWSSSVQSRLRNPPQYHRALA